MRARGFTLLEIMIVIAIVGIMATVAAISFGVLGADTQLEDEAERLVAVIDQTKEESELQGFDVGLRIGAAGYDFLRFDARRQLWLPIVDDDLLAPRELPEGLRFRLWVEGQETTLLQAPAANDVATDAASDGDAVQDERPKQTPPQILVLSSGDLNSFELQLDRDGVAYYKVFSKADNSVQMEQLDARQ